jgi:hypothetical protein
MNLMNFTKAPVFSEIINIIVMDSKLAAISSGAGFAYVAAPHRFLFSYPDLYASRRDPQCFIPTLLSASDVSPLHTA